MLIILRNNVEFKHGNLEGEVKAGSSVIVWEGSEGKAGHVRNGGH